MTARALNAASELNTIPNFKLERFENNIWNVENNGSPKNGNGGGGGGGDGRREIMRNGDNRNVISVVKGSVLFVRFNVVWKGCGGVFKT